ncbi:hypothetical protein GCM10023350_15480 [Nocardioides endophyticus]|uniref:Uncharacterized protein n=1 Tax=Nocardioides endophyticus TaxID=1353775 RepID=A0ABP8YP72_9ACTN
MKSPAGLLRQAADGTGLTDALRQRQAVESLAVAVGENARLAELLEDQVAELERSLVPVLEADQRARQR